METNIFEECKFIIKSIPFQSFVVFISILLSFRIPNVLFNLNVSDYSTSIAFYTIIGSEKYIEDGDDLRGRTWEYQLEYSPISYTYQFVSNGNVTIPGYNVLVLTDSGKYSSDHYLCQRTSNSMLHFYKNYPNTRWFYRGTNDTFLNMTNFLDIIYELEEKYDPMTEIAMAYYQFEFMWRMYPQGGAGYLFSNYAVRLFAENIDFYRNVCFRSADDLAFRDLFDLLNISIGEWHTNRFIHRFPLDLNFNNLKNCPKSFQVYPNSPFLESSLISKLASIHIHHVPMKKMRYYLSSIPEDVGLYCPNAGSIAFCNYSFLI